MKLHVPHYRQSGNNCWYYAVKMIRDYHKRGEPTTYESARQSAIDEKVSKGSVGACDSVNGPITLLGAGFRPLKQTEFNKNTDGSELVNLLTKNGPLFLPLWSDGHASVIVGVEPNSDREVFPDEDWVVWIHDSGMPVGYDPNGLKEVKQKLWEKFPDENLWAFQSKSSKSGSATFSRDKPILLPH